MLDCSDLTHDHAKICRTEQSEREWDRYFFSDALFRSRKSKDRSTKVGAVVVNDRKIPLVSGWNGFPRGVDDDVAARHERPAKYLWTEHAERNAIDNAAAEGIALRGCTMYVAPLMPCNECAKSIIQAGIRRVVAVEPDWTDPRSCETFHFDMTLEMFKEAGVDIDFLALDPVFGRRLQDLISPQAGLA